MRKLTDQQRRVREWLLEHGQITRDDAVYTMRPGINRLSERIRELREEFGMDISEGQRVKGTRNTVYKLLSRPKKMVPHVVEVEGRRMVRFVPESV